MSPSFTAPRSNNSTRWFAFWCLPIVVGLAVPFPSTVDGQEAAALQQKLAAIDAVVLAKESQLRGDPRRGALVFYTSAAACVNCHATDGATSPLGPDLATLGADVTDQHIVESLLNPSNSIRKGYETLRVLVDDGQIFTGLFVRESGSELILRDAANLDQEIRIEKDTIEERVVGKQSMMPDGLVSVLGSYGEFLDLVSYISAVAKGGASRAADLKPPPEQLLIKDDTQDLDHAGIWKRMTRPRDYQKGQQIYDGHCVNCHGADGNQPSLATARAFGKQPLKYGSDPFRMFTTLSRGNGLMAATRHLSPHERYQVVYYIRERFMKDSNPDYQAVTDEYLNQLPVGNDNGKFKPAGERDFGPALASQLGRGISSVLTVKLGEKTIAYDLHSMDQVDVWTGGFLDLSETQHFRGRGERYPEPDGRMLTGLAGWQWAHDGSFDYPDDDIPPRGPLPKRWMDYRGHYLHGDNVVFSYSIDGREILESPVGLPGTDAVRHTLRIGPGQELLLCTAQRSGEDSEQPNSDELIAGVFQSDPSTEMPRMASASTSTAIVGSATNNMIRDFTASMVRGDTDGMTWAVDDQQRLLLRIPESDKPRVIDVVCVAGDDVSELNRIVHVDGEVRNPERLMLGGPSHWPQRLKTTGYTGLETGAYAVDTITFPEETPWNTWFRTSAIDFFPDGRMVVATAGGDIWIVTGLDDDLLDVRWKRYAGGLYEPFGVKVVDETIYVTCKDRLTRLHDFNGDDEADFYESFSADTDVSTFFHAFNFDLHTDSQGNFFYAKCGQYTDHALPGALIKVSADGSERNVVCTGFRTPNGLGMLPDDRVTVSDNQGNWMPASKISLVRPGGFYGYVQTHSSGAWAPDGGRINHKEVVPPKTFDQPIVWMPQDLDNSSGGQIWVDDDRWGPLSGRLLHTSFGKGWLYSVMMQDIDGVQQAAVIKLPHDFATGIMRGRVNPSDGQVYVTGMNGWNNGGRPGLGEGGVYRVRYTGRPIRAIADCRVVPHGLELQFNFALDPTAASEIASYVAEQWNYKWAPNYGSQFYHPETGEVGTQTLEIAEAVVSDDHRRVTLRIPSLVPVNQLQLNVALKDADGRAFKEEVYWTIHKVPH